MNNYIYHLSFIKKNFILLNYNNMNIKKVYISLIVFFIFILFIILYFLIFDNDNKYIELFADTNNEDEYYESFFTRR